MKFWEYRAWSSCTLGKFWAKMLATETDYVLTLATLDTDRIISIFGVLSPKVAKASAVMTVRCCCR